MFHTRNCRHCPRGLLGDTLLNGRKPCARPRQDSECLANRLTWYPWYIWWCCSTAALRGSNVLTCISWWSNGGIFGLRFRHVGHTSLAEWEWNKFGLRAIVVTQMIWGEGETIETDMSSVGRTESYSGRAIEQVVRFWPAKGQRPLAE